MPPGDTDTTVTLKLVGAGGEPVSLRGVLRSHGLAALPPNDVAPDGLSARTTLRCGDAAARTIRLFEPTPGTLGIAIQGRPPSAQIRAAITASVRAMLALDDDLRGFYACVGDPT